MFVSDSWFFKEKSVFSHFWEKRANGKLSIHREKVQNRQNSEKFKGVSH